MGFDIIFCFTMRKVALGYLLFVDRTRQMTQYAATAVADIDPDSARRLLGYFL